MPHVEFMPECLRVAGSPQQAGEPRYTELAVKTKANMLTIAWKKKFAYYIYFKNSTDSTIYVTASERRVRRRERGIGLKAFVFGCSLLCNRDVEREEPLMFTLMPGTEESYTFHDREIYVTIQSRNPPDDEYHYRVHNERLDALMNLRYEIVPDDLQKKIPIEMIQRSNACTSQ